MNLKEFGVVAVAGGNFPRAGLDQSGANAGGGDAAMAPARSEAGNGPAESFTFGRRLRRARMVRQWSQLQLAHRIGKAGAAHRGAAELDSLLIMISKWENDRKVPNQYSLHLLAAALEVPVADLGIPVDPDFVF